MYIPVGFWLNFEVGGDLSLGESFDTLLKEDNRYLFDAVGKAVKLVSIVYVDLK